ncbi:hypothetical protein [Sphingomonas sp. Leaf198]|uniref:hypothetical protein n=1 Tax=Sphingomonas sp. Leaf198 TaxID=1736299 RepID=UPI000AFB523A|nr:hypothetical protein [Sphingomonas sp. Leaf198]
MFQEFAHALGGYDFASKVALAMVPLFGVIGGALASWWVAGRNVYINSITAERSKWLEKLRTSISTFQGAISTYNFRHNMPDVVETTDATDTSDVIKTNAAVDQTKLYEQLERATQLASNIQLQLNPEGAVDKNIIALVRGLSIARHGSNRALTAVDDLLTLHSQWLLKAEWQKVKWEAGGFWYRLWNWFDEDNRRVAYKAFVRGRGAIREPLLALGGSADLDWRSGGPNPKLVTEKAPCWLRKPKPAPATVPPAI